MKIEVSLISGEVYTFDLPAGREPAFLEQLRPAEIFERPLHQFLGRSATVSINPQVIEWIGLDTTEFPSAARQARTMTVRQLSADAFNQLIAESKNATAAVFESDSAQNVLTAYGKAIFRSGRALHVEIRARFDYADERLRASQRIFGMPAVFVSGETGGLFILNTKNIAVWQVVPGLKKSSFFSIPGELVGMHC